MPTFLVISKHSPDNCPIFNAKAKKAMLAYMDKLDVRAKKYGVKLLAAASVPNEHLNVAIYEAKSLEAMEKAGTDPEIMALGAYNTIEIKTALNTEETKKMLLQTR
jgi:hypothetical protein